MDFAPGEGDRILLSGFSSGNATLSDLIDADGDGATDDREITLLNVGDVALSLDDLGIDPQGVFQFSVPFSGWGAENYLVHWGDESVEIAQGRGNWASAADIETALESLQGVRDVEVTGIGSGDNPYRVSLLDADPGSLRVTKGNGKAPVFA